MRLMSVVGARPQFVKVAPVDRAARVSGHEHLIIHTGQHYDPDMSDVFFQELAIPAPDVNLEIGSDSHGRQTGAMMAGLEDVMLDRRPDTVIVYGDTNSTIAAALAAVKQHIPVAHVEAGLRSFNRRMPEEHNRVLTDHFADLLLAPTEIAVGHLEREGLGDRTRLVGDVMYDVFRTVRSAIERRGATDGTTDVSEPPYVLATIHRQENTDDVERLRAIIAALAALPTRVLLPAHPRLRSVAARGGVELDVGSIITCPPLAYGELVRVLLGARSVITDSGGLQKEAFFAGTPCSTVRTETEWVETLANGWNVLVEPGDIAAAVQRPVPSDERGTPYGDGHAGSAVVRAIEAELASAQ